MVDSDINTKTDGDAQVEINQTAIDAQNPDNAGTTNIRIDNDTVNSTSTTFRDQIMDLSSFDKSLIENISTFKSNGVNNSNAVSFIQSSPDGQNLLKMGLDAAGPDADFDVVFNRVVSFVETGVDVPIAIQINTPLVKIVPSGNSVSSFSPFFTTRDQLEIARQSNRPLSDIFGLPAINDASSFDVFEIIPNNDSTTVFKSVIAPTSELNGKFTTTAGATQIIVPDRSQFTEIRLVETIQDNVR